MATRIPRPSEAKEAGKRPPEDLYPTSDIRFVVREVARLETKVDRLIDDVEEHGKKIDVVRHQVTFVKGALWVAGLLIAVAGGIATLVLSGKLSIVLTQPIGH